MSKSKSSGTVFKLGDTAVGGLTSIGGVEISAETIDVTALDNKDGYKEFEEGIKDPGEVPIEGFLDGEDQGQAKMLEALNAGGLHDFSIAFPQKIGKAWSGKCVITKFATSAALNDAVKFSASIKVSGKPTLAATAEPAKA
ncbi:MAG: hypothetical protein E7448_04485 [Ruminococcaceae bacterium]|nr:hypothetical protein [Oscillospiraceae bacterium]